MKKLETHTSKIVGDFIDSIPVEEIEEASRYELEIEIGIAKIQEHIEEVSQSTNQSALNPNAPEYTHVQTHHSLHLAIFTSCRSLIYPHLMETY